MERVKPARSAEPAHGTGYTPIAELEKALKIDENALDDAHLQHADAFYRVSKQLAQLTSQRDAAKQAVEDVEAQTEMDVRETAAKRSDKVTAGEVAAMVRVDDAVMKARQRFLTLSGSVNEHMALKEAFQQRSYMLSGLTSLYSANYFGPRRNESYKEQRQEQQGAYDRGRKRESA